MAENNRDIPLPTSMKRSSRSPSPRGNLAPDMNSKKCKGTIEEKNDQNELVIEEGAHVGEILEQQESNQSDGNQIDGNQSDSSDMGRWDDGLDEPHEIVGVKLGLKMEKVLKTFKIVDQTFLVVKWKDYPIPEPVLMSDYQELYPNLIIEYFESLQMRPTLLTPSEMMANLARTQKPKNKRKRNNKKTNKQQNNKRPKSNTTTI